MRFDHLHVHQQLSRRQVLKLGAAAAGTAALASGGLTGRAAAQPSVEAAAKPPFDPSWGDTEFSDLIFDLADVPGWKDVTSARYGADDRSGTWNEVKPFRTRKALQELMEQLITEYPKTYTLGEQLYNGFPAYPSTPPRLHDQHLLVTGHPIPAGSNAIQGATEPLGPNTLTGFEDRFFDLTYQIATQTDGLNHIGVGTTYYNGVQMDEMIADHGTLELGNETMGPIVTRGVILDIVGLKQDLGETNDLVTFGDHTLLRDDYRITLSDIDVAMRRERIYELRAGDVVLFHTGWTHLADQHTGDHERYLAQEPGIFLAEARYLAASRPALVGGDAWGLEVTSPDVTQGYFFPVHQVLLTQNGIRIGEGYRTHEMIQDNVFEFVITINPQRSIGATAGSTPPVGLGVPSNRGPASVRRR